MTLVTFAPLTCMQHMAKTLFKNIMRIKDRDSIFKIVFQDFSKIFLHLAVHLYFFYILQNIISYFLYANRNVGLLWISVA